MKTENKLLACDLVEFLYRYPELDFWLALKEFEKRKIISEDYFEPPSDPGIYPYPPDRWNPNWSVSVAPPLARPFSVFPQPLKKD